MKKKVIVGMSGGVDSAVSALLLKKEGYEVIGLFMKNWEEDEHCPQRTDYEEALLAAQTLDIPLYSCNFAKEYWDSVFGGFLSDLKKGYTPNPDIFCNKEIKFSHLLNKALELGADFLATGHYAKRDEEGNLYKGNDPHKDQSYFLFTLKADILQKVLFPIGHLTKKEVRSLAKAHNLPNHDRKDSTGICFIGKRDFKEFIMNYIPPKRGTFQTPEGKTVGYHEGAYYYTIGQRKGLGIGGPGDAWFVADKNIETQTITVVQGEHHPLLYGNALMASDLSWVSTTPKPPLSCTAKIRYRQQDQPCIIECFDEDKAYIKFLNPQRAITERQAIVFYQNNLCLGGGLISRKVSF